MHLHRLILTAGSMAAAFSCQFHYRNTYLPIPHENAFKLRENMSNASSRSSSPTLSSFNLEFPTTGTTPPYTPSSPIPSPHSRIRSISISPEPYPDAGPVPPDSLQSSLYALYLAIDTLIVENEPLGIREPPSRHITVRVLWYALDKLYSPDGYVAILRTLPEPLFRIGEEYTTFFVERLEPALLQLKRQDHGDGLDLTSRISWTAEKYIRTLANGIGGRYTQVLDKHMKGELLPELVSILVTCLTRLMEKLEPIVEVLGGLAPLSLSAEVRVETLDRIDRLVTFTQEMVGEFFADRLMENQRAQRLICRYLEEDSGGIGAEIGRKLDAINNADEWRENRG
ncbi:hypothetical protein BJ508DRAFT_100434 [Ascobolus immersus RN42]|uniref:Uncharacterized protein n=1 Tax=Ascobolus immersus RN42 TaxID=1160509 RepID=A0A3N4IK99_ASCIM|nr:hypothetical protein BJ508DRAFT_100434 [Ascobolus immersus RN42]